MKNLIKPIRILQCGLTNNYGGVEAIIMTVYRKINKEKIQFDFLTTFDGKIVCEDEIKKMGGRIFRVEFSKKQNIIKHYTALDIFFKEHANEFAGVHMNRCFPNYSLPLKYAKKYNIPIRIFHSHNSNNMYPSKSPFIKINNYVSKKNITFRATDLFACSKIAGNYMFNNKQFKVINNGIDIEKFKYNHMIREKVRNKMKLKDKIVIGFVGRFQQQKNPLLVLKIFNELQKKDDKYILMMIGCGILQNEIISYIKFNNLEKKVLLLGHRNDVNELYQAMDLFLFPSKFEGLGIVLIEAQASGLYCLTSNTVPVETKVTDRIRYIDLNDSILTWCNMIEKCLELKESRENVYKSVIDNKYDIMHTVSFLEKYYLENSKKI